MADCIIKNDDGLILLNDGTSCILLNAAPVVGGGVTLEGVHAVPLIGARGLQLIPVEFTFWLRAGLLIKVGFKFRLISTLLRVIQSNIKLKSSLLVESASSLKIKSALLIECIREKIGIKSLILTKTRSTFILGSKTENKKLKKVLLRKLREYMEDDD